MLKFVQIVPESYNKICGYNVVLDKTYSCKDFINTILSQYPNGYGHICIGARYQISSDVSIEYESGITSKQFTEDILSRTVKSVFASGDLVKMDYFLRFGD